jgi:mannose-6-phosphate isomerase
VPTVTEPLLLAPRRVAKVWAGRGLGPGIGEAWDLSTHPSGTATVASGAHRGRPLDELVAEALDDFGGPLELLAKRLDCAQPLSVQVHPQDHDPKTEAWVVLRADPGAGVWHGVAEPTDTATLRAAALDGTLPDRLRFVPLEVGQAVFVPAGTLHAIGGGLVLFELQQASDVTFRLYDWGRPDRGLHLDEGLACARTEPAPPVGPPPPPSDDPVALVACEHFAVDRLGAARAELDPAGSWRALHVVAGAARVGDLTARAGATVLVPRSVGPVPVDPEPGFTGLRYGPA